MACYTSKIQLEQTVATGADWNVSSCSTVAPLPVREGAYWSTGASICGATVELEQLNAQR